MAAEATVGFVIETIGNLVINEAKFLAGVSEQVEELQMELERLQSFIRDAHNKKNEKRGIQVWIAQSRDLAYEAEDLLEEYALRILSERKNLFKGITFYFLNECYVRQSIGSKIQTLKGKISNITKSFQEYGINSFLNEKEEDSSSSSQQRLRRTYSHVANDSFIKLDNDVEMLVAHLVNENDDNDVDDDLHKIVSIVGMGGLGKTTLARKVYNHSKIQGYFEKSVWVCISQHWKKIEILRGILVKFSPENRDLIMKWRDEELMRELATEFRNKKCMVVLDDIWSTDVWDSIKEAFPLKKNRSKILLTTRNKNVALQIAPNGIRHEPRLLNDLESWELLKMKALGAKSQIVDEHMHELKKLGEEMVKDCGGLPLAVIVLGGILATKRNIEEWKIVQENVKVHIKRGKDNMEEQVELMNILELSYKELPMKFKPCFLYLARYPEDFEIDVESLYQLWIAEGMISAKDQIGDESMMNVAEHYLSVLAERSLVQVVVNEDMLRMTKFKCCRLHDLIRDLSLEKVKEENLFSYVHSTNGFHDQIYKSSSQTNKIHRLVIHLETFGDNSKYVPSKNRITKHLRSLIFIVEHPYKYKGLIRRIIYSEVCRFRMLRSLEIRGLFLLKYNLPHQFSMDYIKLAKAIGNLIHLRYLSLDGYLLPSSCGNLKQIQTLDLRNLCRPRLPNIFWKMTQLKHLYMPLTSYTFVCKMLRFDGLHKLELFEGFDSSRCCFGDLVELTNLGWFKAKVYLNISLVRTLMLLLDSKISIKIDMSIYIIEDDKGLCITAEERSRILKKMFSSGKILKLDIRISIRSLPKYESGMALNLVHLTLMDSNLQDDPMETLGKFSNLKILELHQNSFLGTKMYCNSGGFLQLRRLFLSQLPNLKEFIVDEGAMPNLSLLTIRDCQELEMIPDRLNFIRT